jgi:hypothetical protein
MNSMSRKFTGRKCPYKFTVPYLHSSSENKETLADFYRKLLYKYDDTETNCITCDQKLLLKNDFEDSTKFHVIEI